jgi:RHS repeat-associated protein
MNNLLSKTDRKGQTINYGYDALYRLTSKTYPDSTAVNYSYDASNRLTQVTDPTGVYSFTYDNLGRLVGTGTRYSFLTGTPLTNSYGYDAASNRVSFTNPQSQITNYVYDSLNRLTGITDFNSGQFGFGYDTLGRRTSLTRPNGVGTSYSYDSLSRLLSVLHAGGALPGSASYTYDAAGNRLTKTAVQVGSPNPVSVLSQYSYDAIYELTQAVVNGSVAEGYTYDAVGNRLTSAGPTSYNYNASNELTSSSTTTYTYDDNGNTTSKATSAGTTSYTWDFENRLSSVMLPGTSGTVNFKYDPFGRRIYKSGPAGTYIYVYDGDNVIQDLGGAGNLLASYTQGLGIDEPLVMYSGPTMSYFHADGLGSIASLTNPAGAVAASYVYDSFGNLTASTGTVTNPYRYTGREFDPETGLYYYRARHYNPTDGRFISEDPARFEGGIDFYRYVGNSPTDFIDPFGWAPRPLSQAERQAVQRLIGQLLNCGNDKSVVAHGIGSDLSLLLSQNKILTDDDMPANAVGKTEPGFFVSPTIVLGHNGFDLVTLVHEWVHTTQLRANPLAPLLVDLNFVQAWLNGTDQGFLDHSAEAVAQKVCADCSR